MHWWVLVHCGCKKTYASRKVPWFFLPSKWVVWFLRNTSQGPYRGPLPMGTFLEKERTTPHALWPQELNPVTYNYGSSSLIYSIVWFTCQKHDHTNKELVEGIPCIYEGRPSVKPCWLQLGTRVYHLVKFTAGACWKFVMCIQAMSIPGYKVRLICQGTFLEILHKPTNT
jgi:hypothetical protein